MILSKYCHFYRLTTFALISMAYKQSSASCVVPCKRLPSVSGADVRKNDVVVCGSLGTATTHIIYFGGDVQDYKENMCINNPAYDYWDLETTARIIQQKFSNSAVFVIKPSEMYLNTFSIYKNFLTFDEEGRPDFSFVCGAILHLKTLYLNACRLMDEECSVKASNVKSNPANSCDSKAKNMHEISLIGFSKGCVVLNQLMFELRLYQNAKDEFLDWITSIYWLDGGHTGGNNAYITDDETLNNIVNLGKKLFVHVTPYQVNDPVRAWIGKEEAKFIEMLKEKGADVIERKHFTDEPASILNHFKVLTVF